MRDKCDEGGTWFRCQPVTIRGATQAMGLAEESQKGKNGHFCSRNTTNLLLEDAKSGLSCLVYLYLRAGS
ncbi:hypothetical protein PG995_010854 [Apiospora arundinis]